ncbi:MAG: DUF6788 family protein [Thermotogota bacterium]|nr:DUF6788 family protein [Thermotogota bacterium]
MNSEIKEINEEISNKLKEVRKRKNMVKGSINKIYTKCGNPNCKCAKGLKHEEYRLTYKGVNRVSKTVYLSKNKIKRVQKMINNYREVRNLFNEIIDLNIKLIKLT